MDKYCIQKRKDEIRNVHIHPHYFTVQSVNLSQKFIIDHSRGATSHPLPSSISLICRDGAGVGGPTASSFLTRGRDTFTLRHQ